MDVCVDVFDEEDGEEDGGEEEERVWAVGDQRAIWSVNNDVNLSVRAHRSRPGCGSSRYGSSGSLSINETGLSAVRGDGGDGGHDVEE